MKIGIATVHDSNNYGSFLQAYALQEVLEKMGHEVYFAKTRDKKFIEAIFVPKLLQKKTVRHPIQMIRDRRNGKRKRDAFFSDQKLFQEIENEKLKDMDIVILGSDEIWNVRVPPFRKGVFYGEGLENVIAYGVSVGKAEKREVLAFPEIISNIRKLPYIFARDVRTQEIVKEIQGIEPRLVCDPTFLVDKTLFREKNKAESRIKEDYVLIYSYGISEDLKHKIKRFAEKNNLKIVSACFYYNWADYNVMCGPLEFCDIIEHASYVITTTFHGTIFSILNEKQFVTFPASIKTNDLLERLGLKQRIMENSSDEEKVWHCLQEERINYAEVNEKIANMREEALGYLEESLESMVKEA